MGSEIIKASRRCALSSPRNAGLPWRSAALLMVGLATGCGQTDPQGVPALNLSSGATDRFSGEDVPLGWATCGDTGCTGVAARIPCQNLGPPLCTQNPRCRLKQLWCEGRGSTSSATATPSGATGETAPEATEPCATSPDAGSNPTKPSASTGDQDPCPTSNAGSPPIAGEPTNPVCYYGCVDAGPLACGEISDAATCDGRPDCSWGPGLCDQSSCDISSSTFDGTCPACPSVCQPLQPLRCDQLDKLSCAERSDCRWKPEPCVCDRLSKCVCKPYCQPQTTCPAIPPLPLGFCTDGKVAPRYDDRNCVIGFDCLVTCPAIPVPSCPENGEAKALHSDQNDCVVGYECPSEKNTITNSVCGGLATEYSHQLLVARECTPSPPTVPVCTLSVPGALACGCPVYVDKRANPDAVEALFALRDKWLALGCDRNVVCAMVPCFTGTIVECVPSSAPDATPSGLCETQ